MTTDLKSATLISLVSMLILPQTAKDANSHFGGLGGLTTSEVMTPNLESFTLTTLVSVLPLTAILMTS